MLSLGQKQITAQLRWQSILRNETKAMTKNLIHQNTNKHKQGCAMKKHSKIIDIQEARKARRNQRKRPKTRKGKRTVVMVTGLTEREFELETRRKRDLPLHRCYLCRREEGERPIVFDEDGEIFSGKPVLSCHSIEVGEGLEFRFLLCSECAVLLGLISNPKIKRTR